MSFSRVFLVAIVAGSSWLACTDTHEHGADAAQVSAADTVYSCPMHPDYTSDEPGTCPVCSMKLVPVGKGKGATRPEDPSLVHISPERQQQIGVKLAEVVREPARVEVRAVGKVAFDETKITHLHSKVNGWIEDVFVDFVGAPVRKGQPLFTIYSPDLVASQQEYLLALRAKRELGSSSFPRVGEGAESLLEHSRRRLALWDMSTAQIRALERSGEVARTITVSSPASGVVTARAAYHHGRYVTPDLELYTIVGLDSVWVVADVYEYELPHVSVGQPVEVVLPYEPERAPLHGVITFVQPFLDPTTRTVGVRMELPNPGGALRPGSFVNVKLQRELGEALTVPRAAVLETGELQYVFVDRGEGRLEPRKVRAGTEIGGERRVVLEGLREGERVVTAAAFVVDSESRLQGAFDAMVRGPGAAAPAPLTEGGHDPHRH